MRRAIEFAKEHASILAECVDNPAENFAWGHFNTRGHVLPIPQGFTKEDFYKALYGVRDSGSTDCIALYEKAREFGADVDVYITDQGHNIGTVNVRVRKYHEDHPEVPKPRCAVIVDFSDGRCTTLEDGLRRAEIPVAVIKPEALKESAMVAEAIKAAVKGEMAVIDEIMATSLPSLPSWYNSL